MSDSLPSLDDLRRRIDEIDDRLQDLLVERTAIVESVAALKKTDGSSAYRPAREAVILRRLNQRHHGRFPRPALMRMWREMLGGTTALQTDFTIAVYAAEDRPGFWDLARDQYGSHTPMLPFHSIGQVVRAVGERQAALGVLPMPQEGEPDPWWRLLLSSDAAAPRVVARLPFAGRGNARADGGDALVIGQGTPEETGADRTYLALEIQGEMSRARLIAAFGGVGLIPVLFTAYSPNPDATLNLIEVDGFVVSGDSRLERAMKVLGEAATRLLWLGGYARPFTPKELDLRTKG